MNDRVLSICMPTYKRRKKITKSIFNYCETDKRMLRRRNSGVHNQC